MIPDSYFKLSQCFLKGSQVRASFFAIFQTVKLFRRLSRNSAAKCIAAKSTGPQGLRNHKEKNQSSSVELNSFLQRLHTDKLSEEKLLNT